MLSSVSGVLQEGGEVENFCRKFHISRPTQVQIPVGKFDIILTCWCKPLFEIAVGLAGITHKG